jgi:hypothetical protein
MQCVLFPLNLLRLVHQRMLLLRPIYWQFFGSWICSSFCTSLSLDYRCVVVHFTTLIYLQCFTSNDKNIVGSPDRSELLLIHQKHPTNKTQSILLCHIMSQTDIRSLHKLILVELRPPIVGV